MPAGPDDEGIGACTNWQWRWQGDGKRVGLLPCVFKTQKEAMEFIEFIASTSLWHHPRQYFNKGQRHARFFNTGREADAAVCQWHFEPLGCSKLSHGWWFLVPLTISRGLHESPVFRGKVLEHHTFVSLRQLQTWERRWGASRSNSQGLMVCRPSEDEHQL